jgi:hypothetical protein
VKLERDGTQRVHVKFNGAEHGTHRYKQQSWDAKFNPFFIVTRLLSDPNGAWRLEVNSFVVANCAAFSVSPTDSSRRYRSEVHAEYVAMTASLMERVFASSTVTPATFMRACEVARHKIDGAMGDAVWEQIGAIDNPAVLCRVMVRAFRDISVAATVQSTSDVGAEIALQTSLLEIDRFDAIRRRVRVPPTELSITVHDAGSAGPGETGSVFRVESTSTTGGNLPWSKYLQGCSRLFTPRHFSGPADCESTRMLAGTWSHSPPRSPPTSPPRSPPHSPRAFVAALPLQRSAGVLFAPRSPRHAAEVETAVRVRATSDETAHESARTAVAPLASAASRAETLALVSSNGWALRGVSEEHKHDREIVLAAVRQTCWALECAAGPLKGDREIVVCAIRQSGWAIEHAAPRLRADRDVVIIAVEQDWHALEFASDALKNDRTVVDAAVRQDWRALDFAGPALLCERDFMLSAVRRDWRALRCAASELLSDCGLVIAACEGDGTALHFASAELKRDGAFVRALGGAILDGRVAVPSNVYGGHYARLDWAMARAALNVPAHVVGSDAVVADISRRGRAIARRWSHFAELADAIAAEVDVSEASLPSASIAEELFARSLELRQRALRVVELCAAAYGTRVAADEEEVYGGGGCGGDRSPPLLLPLPAPDADDVAWRSFAPRSIAIVALCEAPGGQPWHACGHEAILAEPRATLLSHSLALRCVLRVCILCGVHGLPQERRSCLVAMHNALTAAARDVGPRADRMVTARGARVRDAAYAHEIADATRALVAPPLHRSAHDGDGKAAALPDRSPWMCSRHHESTFAFKADAATRKLHAAERRAARAEEKLRAATATNASSARAASEAASERASSPRPSLDDARARVEAEMERAARRVVAAEATASKAVEQSEAALSAAAHARAAADSATAVANRRVAEAEQRAAAARSSADHRVRRAASAAKEAWAEVTAVRRQGEFILYRYTSCAPSHNLTRSPSHIFFGAAPRRRAHRRGASARSGRHRRRCGARARR